MKSESSKEKKKEILNLLTTHNKLRSKDEFYEIKDNLYEACENGDLEMIKILLSEKIENSSRTLKFKIDETNQTASLFKISILNPQYIIPRTVEHKSTEYLITSIVNIGFSIDFIKFSEDSAVKTVYQKAFYHSHIKEIYFPASLKELKEGWCEGADNLRKIIISPSNGQFKFVDDKYLIGKSDENNDEFDTLLFVPRNIEEFSIPSNIKIISSYAFHDCFNIKKIEIPSNSNLQTIGKCAFSRSNIESFFIPPKVSKICESAFHLCSNLKKIEIPPNSILQSIELYAFSSTKIESFSIPLKVSKICEFTFAGCKNLIKIEIPTNSNLQTIESNSFALSKIEEIYFPASLKELKEGWCEGADNLRKIIISPSNGQFKFVDDKYLIGKSDENNDEFDTLLFVPRNIEEFSIPSNIKIISSYAFHDCFNIKKIEIPSNSNLQTIGKCAFSRSNIESFFIPPKVSKICESAFEFCKNLTKIEIPANSNLQTIEQFAFSSSEIKSIFMPSKVTKLSEDAFSFCFDFQIIEFSEESELESLLLSALKYYQKIIIMIPSSLRKWIKTNGSI